MIIDIYIYRVRHIKFYRAIALKLLIISKKPCAIFVAYPDNKPHTNLGRFCNVYGILQAPSTY